MAEAIRADEIVIETMETYSKQTIRNHYSIFGPNGKHTLSIPVIKTNGNKTLTRDVLISTHQPWQKIHWRSIETAYNNSPFFLYYKDQLSGLYEAKFKYLLDLNMEILATLLRLLKISKPVRVTDTFEKTPESANDFRDKFGTKKNDEKYNYPHYTQVFETRHGFIPGLSILDVIFNLGPEAALYLKSLNNSQSA
jgi:hypothetical protein